MLIVSLGNNCSIQLAISKLFKYFNSVFSWCKSYEINKVIECLDNNFEGLLDFKNYKNNYNILYQLNFQHNFIGNKEDKSFNEFKDTIKRKIDRFNNFDNKTVYFVRCDKKIDYFLVNKLFKSLQNKFPKIQIYLIIFGAKIINKKCELNKNIKINIIPNFFNLREIMHRPNIINALAKTN